MIFWINQNVIECNQFSIQDTLKPCRIVKPQQTEIKTAYGEFHKKPAINVSKTEVNRLKVIHKGPGGSPAAYGQEFLDFSILG